MFPHGSLAPAARGRLPLLRGRDCIYVGGDGRDPLTVVHVPQRLRRELLRAHPAGQPVGQLGGCRDLVVRRRHENGPW